MTTGARLCDRCGGELGRGAVHVTDVGAFCASCHNRWAAERLGVRFDGSALAPVTVAGPGGASHRFDITSHLGPTGHAMTAREITSDGSEGYEFRVIGDCEADPLALFARLYERIRAALAAPSLERSEPGWRPKDDRVQGRITWDPDGSGHPVLVIDGRPFTWDEVGRMLASYEGFLVDIRLEDATFVVGGPLLDGDER